MIIDLKTQIIAIFLFIASGFVIHFIHSLFTYKKSHLRDFITTILASILIIKNLEYLNIDLNITLITAFVLGILIFNNFKASSLKNIQDFYLHLKILQKPLFFLIKNAYPPIFKFIDMQIIRLISNVITKKAMKKVQKIQNNAVK